MRVALLGLLFAVAAHGQTEPRTGPPAEEPIVPIPASTMSELMIKVVYPTSDAVLYVGSRTPTTEQEWADLQGKALMLAESANLLLMPERALDQGQWMKDTKLMLDAGIAAFEAAMAKDVDKLIELNEPLYQSCIECHLHYRPDYLKDAKLKLEAPP
ncbi:MAG TPA: hypothetical protein VNB06_01235 [Thermoanaerobaculia bacterium]|nr:hypothetical protein [Thermoanaerobaculia bacterium]